MVVGFILYSSLTYLKDIREEAAQRLVRDQFSRYMSPALVEQLAKHPEELHLGGEMRDMSVLFCDVRDFTSISERFQSDPQGLTSLINRFLTPMTDVILNHRGTIDKYIGDCVMAFWNAPIDDDDHARNACTSAIELQRAVVDLNKRLRIQAEAQDREAVTINVGVGINSGTCCDGNMGSEQRFDYSVLGDPVNLASPPPDGRYVRGRSARRLMVCLCRIRLPRRRNVCRGGRLHPVQQSDLPKIYT